MVGDGINDAPASMLGDVASPFVGGTDTRLTMRGLGKMPSQ